MKEYGNLKVISDCNLSGEYPGCFSKTEIEIIEKNIKGLSLHLFSGNSSIGDCKIDYNLKADYNQDVFEFLAKTTNTFFETIIIDAPYNDKFAKLYSKEVNNDNQFIIFANTEKTTLLFNLISERFLMCNRIILKSWNFYQPKNFQMKEGFLMYPGGYRKPTILLILDKIDSCYDKLT